MTALIILIMIFKTKMKMTATVAVTLTVTVTWILIIINVKKNLKSITRGQVDEQVSFSQEQVESVMKQTIESAKNGDGGTKDIKKILATVLIIVVIMIKKIAMIIQNHIMTEKKKTKMYL